jgi:hypothetical protein
MGKRKIVFKRPVIHHVIAVAYICAPLVNILLLRLFLRLPFSTIFSRMFDAYGPIAAVWLLTAPLVGISLYFVNRVSWYVFLGHSSLILLDFVVKWAIRPAFYLRTIPHSQNALFLAGNLLLVCLIGYVIQKDFRSPYLQVLNRSWRERTRVPIYHDIVVDGAPRTATDLSTGGVFVAEPESARALGSRARLSFASDSLSIDCAGEVMRITPDGCGIRFIGLPLLKRRDIARLLRKRFALRHRVELACTALFSDGERDAVLIDISPGGCYVSAGIQGITAMEPGTLNVELPSGSRTHIPGTVVWVNDAAMDHKPAGFGFRFQRAQRRLVRTVVVRHGKGMLIR